MLGGQKEIREQIACSGNDDATMDKGLDQKGLYQKPGLVGAMINYLTL